MVLGSFPGKLADTWQGDDAKAMDDIPALFNPKLEFYNIAAFIYYYYEFHRIFLTRRKNG